MDISVVLLTWNSEKYIRNCLHLLLEDLQQGQFTYEIFIVDNGSQDNTVPIIREFHNTYPENIFPICLKKNTGTTYSRNLALKQVEGEYICIMDSDIEVSQETIVRLIDTFEDNPKIGLVVPKLVYPNGNLQKSTDVFPTIMTKVSRYFFLRTIEKRENKQHPKIEMREVDYAISAMWVLKREVLENVGLLDENIFYAPEDVDYCLRIWKAGYKVVYSPNSICIHHTQEISRGLKINMATVNHIRGLFYYFRKHKYLFKRPKYAKG